MYWIIFSVLFIAIGLQIVIHEAGHLLFGLVSGYRFVSFRIGSWMVYKREGKLHFGKYSLAGTGGQCLMAPPELQGGKMPYRLYNLGGSLMNLMTAVIAYACSRLFQNNMILQMALFFVAIAGVVFALINGIPMHTSTIDNDGYNALSLGKHPEALRALWIQLKVNEQLTEGVRLKEMPEEWFEQPKEEDLKNSMIAALEALRCSRLLDAMEIEKADWEIRKVLQKEHGMVGVQETLLRLEQVFCEIFGEQRKKILKRMERKDYCKFMGAMKKFPSVLRVQYAYAIMIEQDEKKASKLYKQFEKVMKHYPSKGEADSEWELMQYVISQKKHKSLID